MARKVNAGRPAQEQEGAAAPAEGEESREVIPGASTEIGGPAEHPRQAAIFEPREEGPPPKKFRVVAGPGGAAYMAGGYKTMLRDGKIVDETTYPLKELRAQGVRLQPVEE